MTMTADFAPACNALAASLVTNQWLADGATAKSVLPDGRTLTVSVWYDSTSSPFDADSLGAIYSPESDPNTGLSRRPDECDGAAVKIHDYRGEYVWWQPPSDYDPKGATAWMHKRVKGWFRDDWTYVGLTVTVGAASISAGGIETDCDADGVASIIGDVLYEVLADDTSNVCPCCNQPLPTEETA